MNKKWILVFFLLLVFVPLTFAQQNKSQSNRPVCPGPAAQGNTRCHARIVTDKNGNPQSSNTPAGYGPAQFHAAYNLPLTSSTPVLIAIVDAYDHPNIQSDLNTYMSTFGIKNPGSFQKVNQNGNPSPLPGVNAGWALETSLDVETARALCQNCPILLVEANSSSYTDLMTAVDTAYALGAKVISNSYGSSEFSGEVSYDSHFMNHPGVAITFSSGDSGYKVEYPAASQFVTAVGGTSLYLNNNNTRTKETVWSGTGSGCSQYESKPSFQSGLLTGLCSNRMVADVSADADPNTGAAVYDSVRYQGRKGWFQVGGTSLSSPLIAGVYALGGMVAGTDENSIPYTNSSGNFNDITSGTTSNCDGTSLCTAQTGYDGPSGLGTPLGAGGF